LSRSAKEEKTRIHQEKLADVQNMDREIREFQQLQDKQMTELSGRMRNGIVEEINKVIEARVKAENFDIVLDKSGLSFSSVPVVLYSRSSWDFTNDVITALNKTRSAATESTGPAPAATPTPRFKKGGN